MLRAPRRGVSPPRASVAQSRVVPDVQDRRLAKLASLKQPGRARAVACREFRAPALPIAWTRPSPAICWPANFIFERANFSVIQSPCGKSWAFVLLRRGAVL